MTRHKYPSVLAFFLCAPFWACTTAEKSDIIGCDKEVDTGVGQATINSQEWQTQGVSWSESPTGIQIIFPAIEGYNITIVAQQDESGASISDVDFPTRVILQQGQGGWGILYEDSDSHTTQDGGDGLLILETQTEDALLGCFDFEIEDISVVDGYFHAQSL